MSDIGTVVGTQLKLSGLEKASKRFAADLTRAQDIAVLVAIKENRPITTDDVRDAFLTRHNRELQIGNAMGAIFADDKWECVGRVKSTRRQAHARYIAQWQLKPGAKL